jgi:hypothetical protein
VKVGSLRVLLYPKISSYERKITGFLKVIGLIGGFTGVMTRILKIFGNYFSSKFFSQIMVANLYLTKKKEMTKSFLDKTDST